MSIYIRYQGRKQGQFSEAQLATLLSRGAVSKESEASLDEKNWQPLGSLPVFEKLHKKIVETQLKTVVSPAPPFLDKPVENDIFAIAGFTYDEFAQKVNTIQCSVPIVPPPTPVPVTTSFISSLQENPKLLYTIVGGILGLLLLIAVTATITFGSASPKDKKNASVNEPTSLQLPEMAETPAVPDYSETNQETKSATENSEKEEQAHKEAEAKAAAEKAEQAKAESEAKAAKDADEERRKTLDAELVKTADSLDETFSLKPMSLDVNGAVRRQESLDPKFSSLWQFREKIFFRYVSYVPKKCFSMKNDSPLEIAISYNNDDVFRFFMDENGLHGQWINAPSVTPESFRILNGIALGELEIVQTSNARSIKIVSLFKPVEYTTFRPSQKQISLTDIICDFAALGFSDAHLMISNVKGYRIKYAWKTLMPDVLQFQVEDNDVVQIKLIPQTPIPDNDRNWNIPVEVKEMKRDSALLYRYISGTKIAVEMVDSKVKEGTETVTRVRSDMLQVRRQFNRNNSNASKALRAIGVLNRQLLASNSASAASIRSQISRQELIISNCRSTNNQLEPQLNKLESAYDNYYGRLKILKEYKALLDKPAIIYNSEPITFTMSIPHPTDSERHLKLFSIKEPDLADEKDAVIPEPTDDAMKPVDDKDEEDDNESKDSNERSFLNIDKK
ncbi:MAG: hypothetical protein LBQ50_08010 [Planctomycetaceae bacterium]|jgi:hypothetical protein|nr:hypothetical protein [Planctomycetaceae bacterium]